MRAPGKKTVSTGLSIVALSVLAGCVSRTVVLPPATQPPPAVSPQARTIQLSKTVMSGQSLKLGFYASLHADCSPVGYFRIITKLPPVHGTVIAVNGMDYTNFVKDNQRYACNVKPTPGVIVTYSPAVGYIGPDGVTLDVITPDGIVQTEVFTIDVR